MLSTILEASCEEPTPMTSLVDVHQPQRIQSPEPISEDELTEEEDTERPTGPSIDDMPVSTIFSKNESNSSSIAVDQTFVRLSSRFEVQ